MKMPQTTREITVTELSEKESPILKRIKIRYGVPKPIVSHPAPSRNLCSFTLFLEEYLSSFRLSENDDVSEEVFEGRIEEEVKLRKRIDDARSEGKLLNQSQPSGWSAYTLKRPFEPPRTLAHRDYFLLQALHYSNAWPQKNGGII